MKDDFEKYFVEICENDQKEACLFALSSLAMRHIDTKSKEYFEIIKNVLNTCNVCGPELDKAKSIISSVEDYDQKLIEYLSEMEKNIGNFMLNARNSISQPCVVQEKQRENIKKWWE